MSTLNGFAISLLAAAAALAGDSYVYVGTYTKGASKGIYRFRFNPATGKMTAPEVAAETANPTFLAVSKDHRYLYAANEVGKFKDQPTGSVSAFRIDPASGGLTLLNTVPSEGAGPCHLTIDPSGKYVLVANYGGGTIAVIRIAPDGSLGEATAKIRHTGSSVFKGRQQAPHAHSIYVSADNRYVLAADLGIDRVMVYRFDKATGALTPNDPPSASIKLGSGPRHLAFHPNGKHAYVVNELNSTVTVMDWDARNGVLTEKATLSTLPEGFKGTSWDAEIAIHPNGKHVYASNRGDDSIAAFEVAKDGGLKLTKVTPALVKYPRHFAISPDGGYMFTEGQNSDSIALFRIDQKTGGLTASGDTLTLGSPVCIVFVPAK